ncbi:Bug family tripartite tricarboxylate transporter substrate binding protein [Achromobacter aloeverae]
MKRRSVLKLTLAAGLGTMASWSQAKSGGQDWPTRPVKVIVPFTPGGSTDIAARIVAAHMSQAFGQTFIVENRPGGGGNIGLAAVQRADADGYTLGLITTAHAINATLFKTPGYDLKKGLRQIGIIYSGPLVLAANPDAPFDSVKSLIAYAKKNPGKVNFASTGIGGSTHLAGELFDLKAGIRMTHVPYKGSAPAIADVIGGTCQIMFDTTISSLPHIQAGKLRPLGVTSPRRADQLPQVPTIAEAGLPGYEVAAWNGLCAPAGTPDAVIEKLNASLVKAISQSDIKERMYKLGSSVQPLTAAQFGKFVQAEADKWAEVLVAAKIERV